MLTWTKRRSRGSTTFDAAAPPGTAVAPAVAALWEKTLDEIVDAHPEGAWEILVAYVSIETGDVSVSATTLAEPSADVGRTQVSLRLPDWQDEYDALPDATEAERAFEVGYARLLKRVAAALKVGGSDPAVRARFERLRRRRGFAIYYVDAVEVVSRATLTFLWGNRPPKGIPAGSATDVFTFLLEKAQVYPPSCLTLSRGKLRKVVLPGADVNDRYVDLLAGVPDLAALCGDLKEVRLQRTRIGPAAVERLRALLPGARVIVEDR